MNTSWLERAALYELLALGFRYPTDTLIHALTSGEFAEALEELAKLNGIDAHSIKTSIEDLSEYRGVGTTELIRTLRVEYTYLFIGEKEPVVSPYAGIWWSHKKGIPPLLFVNKETRAVKDFMRSCGITQAVGTNEPLDHIATELEFLHYLCLRRAKVALPDEFSQDVTLPERAYEDFYENHFVPWNQDFAATVREKGRIPFYRALALILESYV